MVNRLVAVDDNFNLPPEVQTQLTGKFEAEFQTSHDEAVAAAATATSKASAASSSASSAAASATVAQEAAATATAPTDEAVDDGIDRAVAAGKVQRGVDLVTKLKNSGDMILVSHRGGVRIYPEHSMEGYRDSFNSGFIIEVDIRKLASGQLVNIHDATTGRTMTGADTAVNSMTIAQWKARSIISPWKGGNEAEPTTWEEVLNEFGGRAVIMAEIKDNAATTDIINSIKDRGLERAVVIQSFTYNTAKQVAAAGIASLFLCGSTSSATPAQMVTDKIEFLGPSTYMTAATIAPYRAAGIKVCPYTVELPADWTALQAKSVDGAFFNDPWGATGRYGRRGRDPFSESRPWYGWAYWADGAHNTAPFNVNFQTSQGGLWYNGLSSPGTLSMKQGWARTLSPVAGTSALRFRGRLTFDSGGGSTTGSGTRWAGVFIGNTPDGLAYVDTSGGAPGQSGYHVLIRRNGTIDIFKVAPSASAVSIASQATTPALSYAGQVNSVEVEVILNGSVITARRLDTGVAATATDNTYRSNMELHLTGNQTNLYWSNISYELMAPSEIGF